MNLGRHRSRNFANSSRLLRKALDPARLHYSLSNSQILLRFILRNGSKGVESGWRLPSYLLAFLPLRPTYGTRAFLVVGTVAEDHDNFNLTLSRSIKSREHGGAMSQLFIPETHFPMHSHCPQRPRVT